jgi:excisionase family DNA binding protein
MTEDERLTLQQTADLLGVSLRTVFRYLAAGKLTPIRDGAERGIQRVHVSHAEAMTLGEKKFRERYGPRKPKSGRT